MRRNLADLKAAAAKVKVEDVFFTAAWRRRASAMTPRTNIYKSEEDYVFAIAKALREEYLEVIKAGVVLQVDDAVLANMFDHLAQESPKRYREWAELRVAALNMALEGIPQDRIRYHICFGSWRRPARCRCAALGHRRPDAEGECRRLFDRSRRMCATSMNGICGKR